MLGIVEIRKDQQIIVKPALKFNQERGAYCCLVNWTGDTMLLSVTPQRLQHECVRVITTGGDLASIFDPENYRLLKGEGISLHSAAHVLDEHTPQTVNIEPTPHGYRTMKILFQNSVETYQKDLHSLDLLLDVMNHPLKSGGLQEGEGSFASQT